LDSFGGTKMVDGFYLILNVVFIGGTVKVSFLFVLLFKQEDGGTEFDFYFFLKNFLFQE
jgi:hypothetical protein